MLKQQTVYNVFRVCLPVTFPPFEGSPRAGAAEYVYRGGGTYTLNNQYIITKSYIQKISSLLTQKKTVLSACNSLLKQCFSTLFQIFSSTNRQIAKLANRQIA